MQYPLYVHRDTATAFRASFPDFPGADVAGNSLEELKRNAQDIVELRYDGSEQLIPTPTCDTSELRKLEMDDLDSVVRGRTDLMRTCSHGNSVPGIHTEIESGD